MKRLSNIDNIPEEYADDPGFQSKMKTVRIGDALGSEKIYVNIDYVKPGARSAKYHSHSKQEEFFLILKGTGILRMDGEEIPVKPGDVVSKPAGRDIAHQFINNGEEILRILDIGTRETGDVCTYPDENTVYIRDKRLPFSINGCLENWTSDPNA